MNLDDYPSFSQLDPNHMLAQIDSLPDQLQAAWEMGSSLPIPGWEGVRQVLIAGMGGSAIAADLMAAYASPVCQAPILIHRDYDLPAWAHGEQTLVIASSHSGDTEETLSAFQAAITAGCRCLAITTGGELAEMANRSGAVLWKFSHAGQPRAAAGTSFGLLLAALTRLGFMPDPFLELEGAVEAMRAQQTHLKADIQVVKNPAKRMAGQLMGRWVTVFGAEALAPVARRWKGQISELAKAWAQFEILPEADHNTLEGLLNPEDVLPHMMALFLRAPSISPRNALRLDLTRQAFMLEGLNTDFIDAQGDTSLAHIWTALHYGDYVAYYLAMAYEVDPGSTQAIEGFKEELQAG